MRWWVMATLFLSAVVAFGLSGPRAVVAQSGSDCMVDPLGPVPGYSVVTLGDFAETNTETDGKLVIGGSMNLTGLSLRIATKVPVTTPPAVVLAVGADLTLGYNGVNTGSLTYGRTLSPAGYRPPNGTAT